MTNLIKTLLVAIAGSIGGSIITFLAMWWSTQRRSEEAEERLKTQLLYEDQKKSLRKLYRVIKENENYGSLKKEVFSFFDGFDSKFLPSELVRNIESKLRELDEYGRKRNLLPPEPSEEEIQGEVERYDEQLEDLPKYERVQREFDRRFRQLKRSMEKLIEKHTEP